MFTLACLNAHCPVRNLGTWHVYDRPSAGRWHADTGTFKVNLVLSGSSALGMFTVDLQLSGGMWTLARLFRVNLVLSGTSALGMFTVDLQLSGGMWTLARLK